MALNPAFKSIHHGSVEYALCIALRDRILRHPLGLYFTTEQLEAETDEFHLTAWDDNQLLACLVLKPVDVFTVKMRQVAVHENLQGQGIGKKLVAFAETFAREHLFKSMVLHARESAIPFYLAQGYELFGEPFTEVSIPHRSMRKKLD